jgi:fatty-acyl-CoA synthase
VPEEAFLAKPVLVAEDAPLAMPLVPSRKGKKRKATAEAKPKGGFTSGLLDLTVLIALAPALLVGAGALGVKFGAFPLASATTRWPWTGRPRPPCWASPRACWP